MGVDTGDQGTALVLVLGLAVIFALWWAAAKWG